MQQELEVGLIAALATGEVQTASADIAIATTCTSDVIDVTDRVGSIVGDTGIVEGFALISAPHTTCAIIVNEAEPGFLEDFKRALETVAPQNREYAHNDAPHAEEFEAPNGYAHIRAAFLSSHSVLLPVRNGTLSLGRWQRIFFVELDGPQEREVSIILLEGAR